MPQVIGIRCVEFGRLPARVGKYDLTRPGRDPLPLRKGTPLQSVLPDGERTRLPDLNIIYGMSGNPSLRSKAEPGAVMVSSRQLPRDLMTPFTLAEEPFASDIIDYCDSLIFTPYITHEQKWCEGFMGAGQELVKALECEDPSRVMFINLFSQQGERFAAEQFYWTISPLLGGMKMLQLLRGKGIFEATPNLTEYYMSRYQGSMLRKLIEVLTAGNPEYEVSDLFQFHKIELSYRDQVAYKAQLRFAPEEATLLALIE